MSNGLGGAFQTSRQIFDNPIWQDVPKFRIFFFIVGNAVFSKKGVRIGDVVIQRGQFLRSLRNLSEDLQYIENRKIKKYSISTISRKISSLVDEERLKIEETELGTLFTIINYDRYQVLDNYKKQPETALEHSGNTDGTVSEHSWNNNKNVKKDKNDKKVLKDIEQDELARQFDTLWKMYPNKKGKAKALLSFKSATKKGVEYQTIENGLKDYVNYCNANSDWYKPAHGQTWFNGARWEDDHAIELKRGSQGGTYYEAPKTNHPDGFDW
ncbi:hypothetical protein [Sporosarcina psychrophila]|uniref:Replication protein n=1 Tax=Sporosarcina psychrophila TaxID=1476 RepID=A0ABV2KEU9_SPOPS